MFELLCTPSLVEALASSIQNIRPEEVDTEYGNFVGNIGLESGGAYQANEIVERWSIPKELVEDYVFNTTLRGKEYNSDVWEDVIHPLFEKLCDEVTTKLLNHFDIKGGFLYTDANMMDGRYSFFWKVY